MFNVTGGELFMILLVALIVLGPERLPSAARRVGKVMAQLRDLSEGFKREVSQALDDPGEPIVKPVSRPQLTALNGGADAGSARSGRPEEATARDAVGETAPTAVEQAEARPLDDGDSQPAAVEGETPQP